MNNKESNIVRRISGDQNFNYLSVYLFAHYAISLKRAKLMRSEFQKRYTTPSLLSFRINFELMCTVFLKSESVTVPLIYASIK